MPSITIHDLTESRELDSETMSAISGGNAWFKKASPVANVDVDVSQNIVQFQNVEVNALNNVGVIGADFGPVKLNVSPEQKASARASF